MTEKFTQPPIVAVEEIPREKPADSTLRNKRDGRQDNPLIIKAIIGKNTAIITDGRRVETVRTGEKSSWGLVGAIMPAGMYIGDKFVASSYETGTTQGSDSSSSPRDSPYSYNWPDDH